MALSLNYNPTRGGLSDLLESGVDYFGGTTGMAKDTGEFMRDVTTARGSDGSNFANHSQGNLLTLQGYNYIANKGSYENGGFMGHDYFGLNSDSNTPVNTVAGFGSPASVDRNKDFNDSVFKFVGNSTQAGDPVAQILGGNTGQNETMSLLERLTSFDMSAHSDYKCTDHKGAVCGANND